MTECLYYNYPDKKILGSVKDPRNLKCKPRIFKELNNSTQFTNDKLMEYMDKNYNDFPDGKNPFSFSKSYINETSDELCNKKGFSLGPQQKLAGQLINPNTNFKNMLIYHGLGSGKTCTGMIIGQAFANKKDKEIMFVVPAALESQYYDEIIGYVQNNEITGCLSQCIIYDPKDNEYRRTYYTSADEQYSIRNLQTKLRQFEEKLNFGENLEEKEIDTLNISIKQTKNSIKLMEKQMFAAVSKVFTITTHDKFINSLIKFDENQVVLKDRLQTGSPLFKENSVLIIDEIQNLISIIGVKYRILYMALKYFAHKDLKKVFLSATPIYDNPFEFALTINLLQPRVPFPINKNKFYDMFVGKIMTNEETGELECSTRDEGNLNYLNSCIINKDLFRYMISGYVSYFKGGNPNAYPYKRTIEMFHELKGDYKTSYVKALEKDINTEIIRLVKKLDKTKEKKTEVDIEKMLFNQFDENDSAGILPMSRQAVNIAFNPVQISEEVTDNENLVREIKTKEIKSSILSKLKNKTNDQIMKELESMSSKFKKIIELGESVSGNIFVYSNWVGAGVEAFSAILDSLGYVRFPAKGTKVYFAWSPSIENDQAIIDAAKRTYNSRNNIDGGLMKFMLGTSSIKEGVSFKHVKQVHVVDPWWNNSRIDQITARAVRLCSHKDLEESERHVDIFRHYAIYPSYYKNTSDSDVEQMFDKLRTEWSQSSQVGLLAVNIIMKTYSWSKYITIDQRILEIANKKTSLNTKFLNLVKSASIDCEIFRDGNLIRLEEYIKQLSPNEYQIYYMNESARINFLRNETKNILTLDEVLNREFSFPNSKNLTKEFTEAEYSEDGETLEPYNGRDAIILKDNSITDDLIMKEDVECWKNNDTLLTLNYSSSEIKDYVINKSKIQADIPKIRKYFLLETKDVENGGIKFSMNDNLKKERIVNCINATVKTNLPADTKKKLNKLIKSINITENTDFKLNYIIEALNLPESEIPFYVELYKTDPKSIESLYKDLKSKN